MKILDKCKEFYDYVVSIYGIDNDIILDRRNKEDFDFPDNTYNWKYSYFSNGSLYFVLEIGYNQYLFKVDYIDGKKQNVQLIKVFESTCQIIDYKAEFNVNYKHNVAYKLKHRKDLLSNVTNFYEVCLQTAISLKEITIETLRFDQLANRSTIKNKVYVNLNPFAKYLDPVTVYNQIYSFLLSKKDKKIVDSRTDVQKLESAGFDRKTSFRKM
jgi:hypothetical protein